MNPDEDPDNDMTDWRWAHIMWQKYRIPFEEWAQKPREAQCAYIASELVARDYPLFGSDRLAKALLTTK